MQPDFYKTMTVIFCHFAFFFCSLSAKDRMKINYYNSNNDNAIVSRSFPMKINALAASQIVSIAKVSVSPCPKIFRYDFDGNTDEWSGILRVFKPVPRGLSSFLRVEMTVGFNFKSKNVGEITLAKDKKQSIEDIKNGQPLTYKIIFPIQNPLPKVTAIFYNNQLLCSGQKDYGQFVTTITLDHTFTTGLSNALKPDPSETQNYTPAMVQTDSQLSQQNTFEFASPSLQMVNFQCGTPEFRAPSSSGLVLGGQQALRGQFPWLAAYIHNGVSESGFICGGSLISQKLVVTAAHCIHNKFESINNRRKPEEATFFFGKHNIDSLTEDRNYIQSGASEFHLHKDWNVNNDKFDADIAIVVLSRRIPFNKFIKPICLWTASSSYSDIIDKEGIVAGWGKTEINSISTSMPKWTKLPVVSNEKCLRSHPVFSTLTSERTFCAGIKDSDTGPCNGDSGSAFVVQTNSKYYLRGVVSSSLFNHIQQSCDTKNYAVFTDVTRFTPWLSGFMNKFG